MNDRLERIDSFLHMLKDIVNENKNFYWEPQQVYSLLVRLGVKREEHYKNNIEKENFDYWISRNEQNFGKDLNCFVEKQWQYFCQFISTKQYERVMRREYDDNYYKLYVPLDRAYIREGANLLFDFIKQNKIEHISKIGSDVRCDDIVIRLINKEDVKKIINFVDSNDYLKQGLIAPNPFLYSEKNIAVACDGSLSFNNIVSCLISNYINTKKINNHLNQVNASDFYNYICNTYNNIFCQNSYNLRDVNKLFFKVKTKKEFFDLRGIYINLLNSINENYNLNTYFEDYDKINNPLHDMNIKILSNSECEMMIDKGLAYLIKQLRSFDAAISIMENYIKKGSDSNISNNVELEKIYNSLNFDLQLKDYFKRNNINSKVYFEQRKENYINTFLVKNNFSDVVYITKSLLNAMYKKYGYDNAKYSLQQFIYYGSVDSFTREFDNRKIRENVQETNNYRGKVIKILQQAHIDLNDFTSVVFNSIISKEDYLYNAMTLTYEKYGRSEQARKHLKYAIKNIIINNDYSGFTRDNDSRFNLIKNVSREDLINFICLTFNCSKIDVEQNIDQACGEYVNQLSEVLGFVITK